MDNPTVFIVSKSAPLSDSVRELVESAGLQADDFASLEAFLSAVDAGRPGCLVFNVEAGDVIDQEKLATMAVACARMPAILITSRGDVATAVCAVKAGAMMIVEKPYRGALLLDSINKALQQDGGVPG